MRISAVDPDPAELAALTASLREICADDAVAAFADPLLAVKYGANNPVDAVYAPVAMPRLNGFELARLMRGFRPGARFHFIADSESERTDAMHFMAESCIFRPVTADALRHAAEEEW